MKATMQANAESESGQRLERRGRPISTAIVGECWRNISSGYGGRTQLAIRAPARTAIRDHFVELIGRSDSGACGV
jgi:hypothetical protein